MPLSTAQMDALTLVKDDRVRYVPIPVSRKEKPYFLVDRKRSPLTATFKSLKRRGLIRQAYPTIRSTEMVLTAKAEGLI